MPMTAEYCVRCYDRMKSNRGTWEDHWQQISDLVLTTRAFTFKPQPGEKRTRRIYDSTGPLSCQIFAASLFGLLTNPGLKWFELTHPDEAVNEDEESRLWLQWATWRIMSAFTMPSMGFYTQAHEVYQDFGAFGTASMILTDSSRSLMNFQARPLSEIYVEEDDNGVIVRTYRYFEMAAEEAFARWGAQAGEHITKLATENDGKNAHEKVAIIHAVEKRPPAERKSGRMDPINKPWASVYCALKDKHKISESGFDENPYIVARFAKSSGEAYGRSPAMHALPDIGMLNAMRKTMIVAQEKIVDPPLEVEANSVEGPIKTAPGSIIYRRQGATRTITPVVANHNGLIIGDKMVDQVRSTVEKHFYLHLFDLPEVDRMTTVEVMQRAQQRHRVLAPMISRIGQEWLGPMIARTFRAHLKFNLLPPMPERLRRSGFDLGIEFKSPLALSQRASEAMNVSQHMQFIQPLAELDPSIIENYDRDQLFRWGALVFNVPQQLIKPAEQVARARQEMRERQANASDLMEAQAAAKAGKDGAQALKAMTDAGR